MLEYKIKENLSKMKERLNGIKKSELLEIILESIENPVIKIDMDYFFKVNKTRENKIKFEECTACAATNFLFKNLDLNIVEIEELTNKINLDHLYLGNNDQAFSLIVNKNFTEDNANLDFKFISDIENLVDDIRYIGHNLSLKELNEFIDDIKEKWDITIPKFDELDLEELKTLSGEYEDFEENLYYWEEHIKYLKKRGL